MLQDIFGGKKWFQSLTAWGAIALAMGMKGVELVCDTGLMERSNCVTVEGWLLTIGSVLSVLGIRKAATAPDMPAPPA